MKVRGHPPAYLGRCLAAGGEKKSRRHLRQGKARQGKGEENSEQWTVNSEPLCSRPFQPGVQMSCCFEFPAPCRTFVERGQKTCFFLGIRKGGGGPVGWGERKREKNVVMVLFSAMQKKKPWSLILDQTRWCSGRSGVKEPRVVMIRIAVPLLIQWNYLLCGYSLSLSLSNSVWWRAMNGADDWFDWWARETTKGRTAQVWQRTDEGLYRYQETRH